MLKIVYICASSHSGSTVLGTWIGDSFGIPMFGEVGKITQDTTNRRCSCGSHLIDCKVWGEVLKNFSQIADLGPDGPVRTIPDNRKIFDLAIQGLSVQSGAALDSSKKTSRLRHLIEDQLEVQVIHLVRNPLHVSESNFAKGRSHLSTFIKWFDEQRRIRDLLESHNLANLLLRYEDWVDDPETTLTALNSFLSSEGKLTFSVNFLATHQPGGNRIRFSTEPVNLRKTPKPLRIGISSRVLLAVALILHMFQAMRYRYLSEMFVELLWPTRSGGGA